VQLAVVGGASDWHAFVFKDSPGERLDDFTRFAFDDDFMTIQVFERLGEAEKGLFECNVHIHVEVVADSAEHCVLLLLDNELDIPLDHVWHLLALSLKRHRVSILHPTLDIN